MPKLDMLDLEGDWKIVNEPVFAQNNCTNLTKLIVECNIVFLPKEPVYIPTLRHLTLVFKDTSSFSNKDADLFPLDRAFSLVSITHFGLDQLKAQQWSRGKWTRSKNLVDSIFGILVDSAMAPALMHVYADRLGWEHVWEEKGIRGFYEWYIGWVEGFEQRGVSLCSLEYFLAAGQPFPEDRWIVPFRDDGLFFLPSTIHNQSAYWFRIGMTFERLCDWEPRRPIETDRWRFM